MSKSYTKSDIIKMLYSHFQGNDYKNLYKDKCINFTGETKDTKENYSKVIVDYLVEHIDDFKKRLGNITVTRCSSYKTKNHNGLSSFNFDERPKGERREEKIAHAMYCQYKDKPALFGKILDYQVPLKNKKDDKGLGKIDLLSVADGPNPGSKKIYFLELKKDNSKETLLRCILEAYTYSKIINKEKLCTDFSLPLKKNEYIIAPLVYKADGFEKQLEFVIPLLKVLDISVEIFVWEYKSGKYVIEQMENQ
ncbi:MAG: hypothetical protein K6E69_02820 [Treponema sp.]|uniref:hypothetical protein n=1 Tax=Treponema sp. TaxID=166 RepID=UPI00298EAB9C|nr:hypothetical protein [Treponema sp.]MCR5386030.1 hypothetical protein [Treponema sp.]